jgi:hypothetical protein
MKSRFHVETCRHDAIESDWYEDVDDVAAVRDIIRVTDLSEKIIRVLVKNASLAELQALRRLGAIPC